MEMNRGAGIGGDLPLPPPFSYDGLEVPYTAVQLEPTIRRLRLALSEDIERPTGSPQQRLAAAWTRIAELRLPRKAVPQPVLQEIEDMVIVWDRYGRGGIGRAAAVLSDEAVEREVERIRWMLTATEYAAVTGPDEPVVPTE